jgi:hypothetical protein
MLVLFIPNSRESPLMFILITPNEDGDHMKIFETEAKLAVWLDDMYGEDTTTSVEFRDEEFLKANPDPHYWPEKFSPLGSRTVTAVLIKNPHVLVPKVVEVVRRWEV